MPKLKAVKAKLHREFRGQIKSATVSQAFSGKYYLSILVETEHKELAHTNDSIGIDLGIKDLCITPVEIVGYEVDEAGRPLALDNG